MARKRWSIPVTIVMIALGLMLAVSFRTTQELQKEKASSARRHETFINVLDKADGQRRSLEREVADLRQQIATGKEGRGKTQVSEKINAEINEIKILSGEVSVTGPGLLVTMDDREAAGTLIYSGDIKDILNILRYGGAEAIAVNGQRIVATTAVHEAGRNLLVNKVPINRSNGLPYEFLAIGDAEKLQNYLQVTYGLVPDLESSGVKISIAKQTKVIIPAYTGGYDFKFARTVPERGKEAS